MGKKKCPFGHLSFGHLSSATQSGAGAGGRVQPTLASLDEVDGTAGAGKNRMGTTPTETCDQTSKSNSCFCGSFRDLAVRGLIQMLSSANLPLSLRDRFVALVHPWPISR